MKVLANDGLSNSGINELKSAGFDVITDKVEQDSLIDYINSNNIEKHGGYNPVYVVLRLSPSGDFGIPIDAYSPCFRQTGKPRPGNIGPSVHWHYVALSKGCA